MLSDCIIQRDDGTYAVDGGVSISSVNETLDADFEVEGVRISEVVVRESVESREDEQRV